MILLGRYKQSSTLYSDVVLFRAMNWLLAGVKYPSVVWYSLRHTSGHCTALPTSPAKGECIVVTYILMKPEHVTAYQHVLLTKK